MLTNGTTVGAPRVSPPVTARTVVIVNGSADILELLDTVLEADRYEIVFVESSEHAYSQVKRVRPDLVIFLGRIENMDGCQALSMLKLDEETRNIPVLAYTTEYDGHEADGEALEPFEGRIVAPEPAFRMN